MRHSRTYSNWFSTSPASWGGFKQAQLSLFRWGHCLLEISRSTNLQLSNVFTDRRLWFHLLYFISAIICHHLPSFAIICHPNLDSATDKPEQNHRRKICMRVASSMVNSDESFVGLLWYPNGLTLTHPHTTSVNYYLLIFGSPWDNSKLDSV